MTDCTSDLGPALYESGAMPAGAGRFLRPGGSQLTARAVSCGAWRPGERIIDIGCGRGATLDFLRHSGFSAIGVDISASALRRAKELDEDAALVQASGDALPFADASTDGVLAECSLSLMADAPKALADFHRVLRDDGRLVITDVYARNPQALDRSNQHLPSCVAGVLGKDRTVSQLQDAGFAIDRWEDHSGVLTAFIAQFIFVHGSLGALWGRPPADSVDWNDAIKRLRPGYALLVARKGRG